MNYYEDSIYQVFCEMLVISMIIWLCFVFTYLGYKKSKETYKRRQTNKKLWQKVVLNKQLRRK